MDVVRMYRCGYNNYYFFPTPLVLALFASNIPISLLIFLMFFRSLIIKQFSVPCTSGSRCT